MSHPDRFASPRGVSRNTVIVGCVVALHAAGLWALQSGLVRRTAELIIPAEVLSEFIAPPAPPAPKPPQPTPTPPPPPDPAHPALQPVEGVPIEAYVRMVAVQMQSPDLAPEQYADAATQLGFPAGRWIAVMGEWGNRVVAGPPASTRYAQLVCELLG